MRTGSTRSSFNPRPSDDDPFKLIEVPGLDASALELGQRRGVDPLGGQRERPDAAEEARKARQTVGRGVGAGLAAKQ